MPNITILKEMIKESAITPLVINRHGGKNKVILEEPSEYSVTINGMPDDANVIVFKVDDFPSPNSIFKGTKGECKRADFVIIADTDNNSVILFIELKAKTKTAETSKIIQQLKGAQCVIKYSKEIGRLFWDPLFLDGFEKRFVCLRNISISKKVTRFSTATDIHNTPEKMLKISCPHYLQFNQLVGRL